MPQALCLLHANCQGEALLPLLQNTPAFARRFAVRHYVNYTQEHIHSQDLSQCALFLYQRLAPKWGDISTDNILPRLPQSCQTIEIPNLFFKGYWPFWTSKTSINFGDSLLESLLERGLNPEEALHVYLRATPGLMGDVAAVAEESLRREEEKQAQSPIVCAPLLRELWQKEQLFITVNHPGRTLMFHMADSLLRLIGLGGLPQAVRRAYTHPLEDFWLPIHPEAGALLGLPFASPARRYPVYQTSLTHAQYTSCYLACKSHDTPDLITFLKNLPPRPAACAENRRSSS